MAFQDIFEGFDGQICPIFIDHPFKNYLDMGLRVQFMISSAKSEVLRDQWPCLTKTTMIILSKQDQNQLKNQIIKQQNRKTVSDANFIYYKLIINMWIIDIAVAIAPVIGYYSQLQLIKKQKSIGTFSIYVCAILMISAILRIYFWITNGYAINLLFQAMFIIIIQAMLLNQCIENSERPKDLGEEEKFWNWNSFDQYVKFLLFFTAGVGFATFLSKIMWIPFYGTFLGFASMSIEATLGLPQLLNNYRTKSVEGLSFFMIFTWFAGDFLKTLYFVIEAQPVQFIMCGTIQLSVDIMIILQIINYKKIDPKLYNPVPSDQIPPLKYIVNEELGS